MRTSSIPTTLAGADEHTSLEHLLSLAAWPHVEIGLLYTFAPDGRQRYPSLAWLTNVIPRVASVGRVAVHICGARARQRLLAGELNKLLGPVGRIQVNGILDPTETEHVCGLFPEKTVITQHCAGNEALAASVQAQNHALLVDASGGRGIPSSVWTRPEATKDVGFAGGLGPDTLSAAIPKIRAIAIGNWWIDMEGALRDSNGWFNARPYGPAQAVARRTQGRDLS
jgi:hypothetical protein